jgi:20S proteasome alpha/beta subunit
MTICIAAICEKGSTLVLASDRAVTSNLSIEFEHPGKKMTLLSEGCYAMTAGDALAYTELFEEAQDEIAAHKAPSIKEIVAKVKACYQERRKAEIIENFLVPKGFNDFNDYYKAQKLLFPDMIMAIQNQMDNYNYGLQILLAGISRGKAHIYEIVDPGVSRCWDAMGYQAIGSGLPHALYTFIARNCNQDMSLEEVLLITYEAKKMAERAPGVGANITDICIVASSNTYLSNEEQIKELDLIYCKWIKSNDEGKAEASKFLEKVKKVRDDGKTL